MARVLVCALIASFLTLATAPTVSAEDRKILQVDINDPLAIGGVVFRIVDDIVGIQVSAQEIRGYSQDGTPLGKIGRAFFYVNSADLVAEILLDEKNQIRRISAEDFHAPEVRDGTLQMAVLILLEYSSPELVLGYATVDVILTLTTGEGADEWVINSVDKAGTYASTFISSLPAKFKRAETWIRGRASQIWKYVESEVGGLCAGIILIPTVGLGIVAVRSRSRVEVPIRRS